MILPSKKKSSVHFAEITGEYRNVPTNPDPFFHYRDVNWFATDVPRSNFEQDILYSLGAFMTIRKITRNDAENRIREMSKNNWTLSSWKKPPPPKGEEIIPLTDLEQFAKDQIAKYIIRKFKGHGMAELVEAILKAQGYTTFRSPEGPDRGIDILAAPGPLGFGTPRLCVQVKSSESPIDRPTLDQLIGAMQNFSADQGLLVSWGGFKTTVDKEVPSQFFKVRLWDQAAIIDELVKNYEKLPEDLKAELPLKRVWALATSELDQGN